MKNKNTYIVLIIIFSVICIYNIQYTFRRISLDNELNDMTSGERAEWLEDADHTETYNTLVQNSLSLGLDLQGGMYVTLEIGVDDVLKALAGTSVDEEFQAALDSANAMRATTDRNFVDLFFDVFNEQNPNKNINAYFSPEVTGLGFNAPESDLRNKLKEEAGTAVDNSLKVLRTRIDQFGVASANIQKLDNGRIIVELPGVKDDKRVRELLKKTAELEFWPVYTLEEAYPIMVRINEAVQVLEGVEIDDTSATDTTTEDGEAPEGEDADEQTQDADDLLTDGDEPADEEAPEEAPAEEEATQDADDLLADAEEADEDTTQDVEDVLGEGETDDGMTTPEEAAGGEDEAEKFKRENPFFAICFPPQVTRENQEYFLSAPEVGYAKASDTAQVNAYLRDSTVQSVMPSDIKFLWTAKPSQEEGKVFTLIAIRTNIEDKAPLTGEVVEETSVDRDQNNQVVINMRMDREGRRIWGKMTTENQGRPIAVVLDNLVYTYPNVNEPILNGSSQISGSFTPQEAQDLANILKAGKLPAPARIEGIEIVGPSLGAATVNKGMFSFIGGFIAVILFMLLYYKRVGLIADLALIINLFFVLGIMSALQVVLTLPGIAGIVLSMGMAVDANVLIYERVREELNKGKSIKGAINAGFQNAFSAIIDGNITTFLTGVILFSFGTGPIAGFAVTLMIGIITTLISALLVTRLMLLRAADQPNASEKLRFPAGITGYFQRKQFNFVAKRKTSYALVAVLAVGLIGAIAGLGFKTGVDFEGGQQFVVKFENQVPSNAQLRTELKDDFGGVEPEVRTIGAEDSQLMITTSYTPNTDDDQAVKKALLKGLSSFNVSEENIIRETKVGPTIAQDIKEGAIQAVIFSLIVVFLYIFARFAGWQFGIGALVSLAFNVIVVLGLFALLGQLQLPFSVEIDQAFIAAVLTIVGYTINDTVVVFDRIREAIREDKANTPVPTLFNRAINDTLSRTIVTSVTTLITALILFLFAGDNLKGFMLALMVGIIVGTLSSIFVASPLALDLAKKSIEKRREDKKTKVTGRRKSGVKTTTA